MEDLLTKLAEILEVDEVKPSDVLQDFENWDSLTSLSVLATLDSSYGVNLATDDLRQMVTVGDLVTKVESLKRK
jgi:acyl carrier protein